MTASSAGVVGESSPDLTLPPELCLGLLGGCWITGCVRNLVSAAAASAKSLVSSCHQTGTVAIENTRARACTRRNRVESAGGSAGCATGADEHASKPSTLICNVLACVLCALCRAQLPP